MFNYKKFDNQTIINTSINLLNIRGLILIVLLLSYYSLVKFLKFLYRYYNNSFRINI